MFIQVFSLESKNQLISQGYKFIMEQKLGENKVYVFENNNKLKFEDSNMKYILSNKLYF